MPSSMVTEKFGNLGLGTPFMLINNYSNVYIKIDEVFGYDGEYQKRDYNTICLNDGRLVWTNDISTTILVYVHAGVEYKYECHYKQLGKGE